MGTLDAMSFFLNVEKLILSLGRIINNLHELLNHFGLLSDSVLNATSALNPLIEHMGNAVVANLGDGVPGVAEVSHELTQGFVTICS